MLGLAPIHTVRWVKHVREGKAEKTPSDNARWLQTTQTVRTSETPNDAPDTKTLAPQPFPNITSWRKSQYNVWRLAYYIVVVALVAWLVQWQALDLDIVPRRIFLGGVVLYWPAMEAILALHQRLHPSSFRRLEEGGNAYRFWIFHVTVLALPLKLAQMPICYHAIETSPARHAFGGVQGQKVATNASQQLCVGQRLWLYAAELPYVLGRWELPIHHVLSIAAEATMMLAGVPLMQLHVMHLGLFDEFPVMVRVWTSAIGVGEGARVQWWLARVQVVAPLLSRVSFTSWNLYTLCFRTTGMMMEKLPLGAGLLFYIVYGLQLSWKRGRALGWWEVVLDKPGHLLLAQRRYKVSLFVLCYCMGGCVCALAVSALSLDWIEALATCLLFEAALHVGAYFEGEDLHKASSNHLASSCAHVAAFLAIVALLRWELVGSSEAAGLALGTRVVVSWAEYLMLGSRRPYLRRSSGADTFCWMRVCPFDAAFLATVVEGMHAAGTGASATLNFPSPGGLAYAVPVAVYGLIRLALRLAACSRGCRKAGRWLMKPMHLGSLAAAAILGSYFGWYFWHGLGSS